MYSFLFKNRWFALIFVALMVFGVFNLVGTPDDEGILARVGDDINKEKSEFEREASALNDPDASPPSTSPTPQNTYQPDVPDDYYMIEDELLIDDAAGIYPVPDVNPDLEAGIIAEDEEVYIVDEDDQDDD